MDENEVLGVEDIFEEEPESGLLDDGEEVSGEEAPAEDSAGLAQEQENGGAEGQENASSQAPDENGEPQRYTIEAGGRQFSMTMADLQAAAVRGIQADEILREQNRQRNSPEMRLISRLAAQNGMNTAQYVQAVEEQLRRQEVDRMTAAGVPAEYAQRLLELERRDRERQQAEQAAARKAQTDQDFKDFVAAYPDVQTFPPEVAQAIRQGQKPLAAYQAYENRQLKAQLAAMKKNEENRQKTQGSLSGDGAAPEIDAFLSGFGPA